MRLNGVTCFKESHQPFSMPSGTSSPLLLYAPGNSLLTDDGAHPPKV